MTNLTSNILPFPIRHALIQTASQPTGLKPAIPHPLVTGNKNTVEGDEYREHVACIVGVAILNLRPATQEEIVGVRDLLDADWLKADLEKTAVRFATIELAQKHLADVRGKRLPEIQKVEQEVKARLKKEINYWDARAFELKEEERAGKKTRLNWQNAQRRAKDLAERLKRRMEGLEKERFISAHRLGCGAA